MRLPVLLIAFLCQVMSFLGVAQTLTNIQVLQEKSFDPVNLKSASLTQPIMEEFISLAKTTTPVKEVENWKHASRYLKNNPREVGKLLRMQKLYPEIKISDKDSENDAVKATTYTIMAEQSYDAIDEYFIKHSITGDNRTEIFHEIEAIRSLIKRSNLPAVIISATGNIRSIASDQESAEPGAKGTGTFSVVYTENHNIWAAQLSVASTLDTLRGELGIFILSPNDGNFLKSGSLEWYHEFKDKDWLHVYTNVASQKWELLKKDHYKDATILGLGVLYRYRLIEGMVAQTDIGLDMEIGISARWIGGNVRNLLDTEQGSDLYKKVLPTEKSGFYGLEAGFAVNFGQVVGGLQLYHYFGKDTDHVDHLTGLQLAVGLSVRGDLLKAFVDSKD